MAMLPTADPGPGPDNSREERVKDAELRLRCLELAMEAIRIGGEQRTPYEAALEYFVFIKVGLPRQHPAPDDAVCEAV